MDSPNAGMIIGYINVIFILLFIFMGVYSFILFVKLAHRGIRALDIYIKGEKEKNS